MSTFNNSMIKYFELKNKLKAISILSIPKKEGKKKKKKTKKQNYLKLVGPNRPPKKHKENFVFQIFQENIP